MPVIRKDKSGKMIELPSDRVTKACAYMISVAQVPDWRNDPTYNMRKK